MSALQAQLASVLGADAVPPISGTTVPIVMPQTIEAAAEALRFASRERLRVLPAGSMAHLDGVGACDFVLSSTHMRRVIEYEPEDLVAVVESGLPLAVLEAALAAQSQRLAPDPWSAGGASVGGAVAADRCGLSRRARGTWRDAVLGVRVVHADGRVSKTGGRVVKNVAGFDLAKLYVGSRGALAWIAELALRLVPRAAAARTLASVCSRLGAHERLLALHRAALAPQALLYVAGDAAPATVAPDGAIVVRFDGAPQAVDVQVRTAMALGGDWLEIDEVAWDRLRQHLEPRSDARVLRLCTRPTAIMASLDALDAASPRAVVAQFGVGIVHAHVDWASDLGALAARLSACGARLVIEPQPDPTARASSAARTPALGADMDPVALQLAVATKTALDPRATFPRHPDLGGAA